MKIKKITALLSLVFTFTIVSSSFANAFEQNEKWYLNPDGTMAHDTVFDGYKLDSNGVWVKENTESEEENYRFTEGLNKFCIDSASLVLENDDKNQNIVYSPVSLYMALSVLSEGAENDTKNQILNVLNASDPINLTNSITNYKNQTFNKESGNLLTADSIWFDDSISINYNTVDKIKKLYGAEIFNLDLQDEKTPKKISEWILNKTKGKLGQNEESYKASSLELMKLFNSIYFKDAWEKEFNINSTKEKDFYSSLGETIKTDFMTNKVYSKFYKGNNDYTCSNLQFKNGNNMMFILPDEGKSVNDIINDRNKLNEALSSLSSEDSYYAQVSFEVPKFNFTSNLDLDECARKLGLEDLYSMSCDLTKFSDSKSLCVSNIKQDATVTIDESGAEAAAVTEISVKGVSIEPQENNESLVLNRPFIFAIMDDNNIPIFIGVINNLEEK